MAYCNACGEQLQSPEEDMFDPADDGEYSGEHIKVVRGEKGERFQCTQSGQITKIADEPPSDDGSGSGGNGQVGQSQAAGVFDLPEEKDAMSVLNEVVANPVYDLSEEQINEVNSWGSIYDGQIPPDVLNNLLENLSGVSNQKASLMRQKYEAMLNRWVRQQTEQSEPPQIGALAAGPPQAYPGQQPRQVRQQSSQPVQPTPEEAPEESDRNTSADDPSEGGDRRSRRVQRRHDMIDTMAEQMAVNMAEDAGQFYTDMREIMTTLIKKKAERDPEWFFEKADAFGVDIIDELATPSQSKQETKEQQAGQSMTDAEVDTALDELMDNEETSESETVAETPMGEGGNGRSSDPMSAAPGDEYDEGSDESSEEEAFEEIMGDIEH